MTQLSPEAAQEIAARVMLARASLMEFMAEQEKAGAVDQRVATAYKELRIASALLNVEH